MYGCRPKSLSTTEAAQMQLMLNLLLCFHFYSRLKEGTTEEKTTKHIRAYNEKYTGGTVSLTMHWQYLTKSRDPRANCLNTATFRLFYSYWQKLTSMAETFMLLDAITVTPTALRRLINRCVIIIVIINIINKQQMNSTQTLDVNRPKYRKKST